MTAYPGKIESFAETQEDWKAYVELVEQFFLANNIDVPALLGLIDSKTCILLRDLLTPDKPATKTFKEIVTTLQQHLIPKPLVIAERSLFCKRNQRKQETVMTYVTDFKRLAALDASSSVSIITYDLHIDNFNDLALQKTDFMLKKIILGRTLLMSE